jgi:hypothetical protein
MQQQMGISMIGFAAYRDEDGKLCTFEYDASTYSLHQGMADHTCRFCTEDQQTTEFVKGHSKNVDAFLTEWGKFIGTGITEFQLL